MGSFGRRMPTLAGVPPERRWDLLEPPVRPEDLAEYYKTVEEANKQPAGPGPDWLVDNPFTRSLSGISELTDIPPALAEHYGRSLLARRFIGENPWVQDPMGTTLEAIPQAATVGGALIGGEGVMPATRSAALWGAGGQVAEQGLRAATGRNPPKSLGEAGGRVAFGAAESAFPEFGGQVLMNKLAKNLWEAAPKKEIAQALKTELEQFFPHIAELTSSASKLLEHKLLQFTNRFFVYPTVAAMLSAWHGEISEGLAVGASLAQKEEGALRDLALHMIRSVLEDPDVKKMVGLGERTEIPERREISEKAERRETPRPAEPIDISKPIDIGPSRWLGR